MKPTIHFVNNIAPHYLKPLIDQLLQSEKFNFIFSSGKNEKIGIKNIDFKEDVYKGYSEAINDSVKNTWVKGKYLIWQKGVISKCLFDKKIDLVILLGEFNVLSNWVAALICRIRGIKVAFRGHGLYGNESMLKLFLRTTYYKLANIQMVYERRSKSLLIENGFKKKNIHVVFNSLDYDYQKLQREKLEVINRNKVYHFFDNPNLPILIFSGRLTRIKKLEMVLETCKRINHSQDQKVNLLIIGDGEEKTKLEDFANKNLPKGTFHFYGSCYDEDVIGRFLAKADLCVSPGNVGLTAIHSLSYGTPICTHNNFSNQMPEAEAIEEGKTGFFFQENNLDDLYSKTRDWLSKHPKKTTKLKQDCYEIIDLYYNPYFQEKVFYTVAMNQEPLV